MAINLTVVFAVLAVLGAIMVITHKIDPTKKKPNEPAKSVAPAAAPVTAAAPV